MPDLIPGYRYEVMTRAALQPFLERYREVVFSDHHLGTHYAHSELEQAAISTLAENLSERFTLCFGVFQGDAFVGWHLGQQVMAGFEMTSTGILKEHRRRGLYSALIPVVLGAVQKEGFQIVYSRHNLTNNAVIIPKLKAGFVISGLEVEDRYGALVQLSYYFNPLRRKMLEVRVGQSAPDDEVRACFSWVYVTF